MGANGGFLERGTLQTALGRFCAGRRGHRWRARIAAVFAVVTTVLTLPTGKLLFVVASLLSLAYFVAVVVIDHFVGSHRIDLATGIIDVGAVSTTALLVPTTSQPALMLSSLLVVTSVPGTQSSVEMATVVTVLFSVVAVLNGSASLMISVAGFACFFVVISFATRDRRDRDAEAAAQLATLSSAANAIFWKIDRRTGVVLSITGDVYGLLGFRPSEIVGRKTSATMSLAVRAAIRNELAAAGSSASVSSDLPIRNREGTPVPFRHLLRLGDADEPHVVQGVSFEIAELEEASEALRQYRDLFFHLSSAVLVAQRFHTTSTVDPFVISHVNPACKQVLGLDSELAAGRHLRSCLPNLSEKQHHLLMAGEVVRVQGVVPTLGDDRSLDVRIFNLSDDVAAILVEDVTQAVVAEQTVRYQAEHDELTGLANRTVLQSTLADLFDPRNPRASDEVALLMLDLDRFKEVNDTLGHAAGDELLRIVGRRLLEQIGDNDLVARLGGDEFAVLLNGMAVADRAPRLAERITAALEVPATVDGIALRATASIGIALAPNHGSDPETLLRRADIAMYEAKRTDRSFHLFELSKAEPTIERLELSSQIGAAISAGQFELWFQPKFCLASGKIMGAEGLLRWRHPDRGILAPAAFLELVSLTGEHQQLTRRVLSMGIEQAATCAAAGHRIEIAINVSALSLVDHQICADIARLLDDHGVSPDQIILEITESDALGDAAASQTVLHQLGQMGIGLSIDDFGTGHSSLVRLRHLPVTEVKIDRSFVGALHDDNEDFIIVRSIVGLAHDLGHRTVAEGVDSPSAARLLADLGCDLAQGYLYSLPLHPDELMRRLDKPAGFGEMYEVVQPPTPLPQRREPQPAAERRDTVRAVAL